MRPGRLHRVGRRCAALSRTWLLGALLCASAACTPEPPLPDLATIPPFTLTDQAGKPFGDAQLRGHVWIGNFIFTRCPDICPLLTEDLAAVRRELGDDSGLRFVSFSVDPVHDTPRVLRDYRQAHGAAFADWHFLTGPLEAVEATVRGGLKQAMDRHPDEPTNIMHGSHFVLVDGRARVRGFYRTEPEGLAQLVADARRLAAQ